MILLLAGIFFIFVHGVLAQRPPLDTLAPITRIAPPLRKGQTDPDNFGFAIALYQLDPAGTNISTWRVVVGAPNGSYPGGLAININPNCPPINSSVTNNTGLVYLCSIQPGKDTCDGAVGNGSINDGRLFDCPSLSTMSFQQMGASLYSSGGYLIACAPGYFTGTSTNPEHKGVCYVSFNNSLRTFSQTLPCRSPSPSLVSNDEKFCYSGFSLALKNKIAIFGNPLAFTTGMASYLQLDTPPTSFSVIATKGTTVSTGGLVYGSTSMNVNGNITYQTNTLKGYSVGIGRITRSNISDYLVAIPRWSVNNYVGSVEVFSFPNTGAPFAGPSSILSASNAASSDVGVYNSLMTVAAYGTQTGEQFGASMDTADLDQDGYDELIVGAPFYTDYSTFSHEVGRVYVFQNTKGNLSATPIILSSTTPSPGGRFGHVVLSVGDINSDGTEDFAVGAPYEPCTSSDGTSSTGSVYLYAGGRTTLATQVQKITACDIRQNSVTALNNATLRSFGYSLASKGDLDGNSYNDLAIGAFESRAVFILRTFSVANITSTLTNVGGSISATKAGCNSQFACGTLMLCAIYNCSSRPGSCNSNLGLTFVIKELTGRASFPNTTLSTSIMTNMVTQSCSNITFYSMLGQANLSQFQFTAEVVNLSRNLVSDGSTALADFKAIPILNGGSSSVNVNFQRSCAIPNACSSQLALSSSALTLNLVVNVTTSISLYLTVNNSGDEVFGVNLALLAPPCVTEMKIIKPSGTSTCSFTNMTGFSCPSIFDGYLTSGNISVIMVALSIDATSIPFDQTTLMFNVSSSDIETNVQDNLLTLALQPTVDASTSINIVSTSFSPAATTYTTPTTTGNPINLASIGLLSTFEISFQRSGRTYIPSLTVSLALPVGGNNWNSYYLYPASLTTTVSTLGVSCVPGVLNPYNLTLTPSKKRSVTADVVRYLPRDTRQAQGLTLDCSQLSPPSGCKNLVCSITNISATPSFSIKVSLYVNDRFFVAQGTYGNASFTASENVSISTAIFRGVILKSAGKAVLSITAAQTPSPPPLNLALIIAPIVAVVVIIVIAVVVLYACGFFKRKKRENEDAVEGVQGTVATVALTQKDPLEDSTMKEPMGGAV